MSTPCDQQYNFVNINNTLIRMEQAQDEDRRERRESEKRLMNILEKLADQGARVGNLEEHAELYYRELNEVATRVRDVELNQAAHGPTALARFSGILDEITRQQDSMSKRVEKLVTSYKLATGKYALWAYGVLVSLTLFGFVSDLTNHWVWVKSILKIWNGNG